MYQSHIAIVGLACRFPGANGPDEFWQLLKDGVDTVREVPSSRWDAQAAAALAADPRAGASRWAGLVDGIDQFDAKFFGISAREARAMDPQQRLLLEVTWEALEAAGLRREDIAGSATDVFIGIAANDYSHIQDTSPDTLEVYDATGNALSIAANRISYLFDLRGASMAVDTACSSSLSAVHLACRRLRDGEADTAIAGGASLILSPAPSLVFAQSGMLAADGHCKTFDAAADGYVRGEGVGVVVLKRYDDAVRDGDTIYAVIRGSAANQDGRSNGLTAPNGLAQEAVIRAALADAGVDPHDIGYVEAHGTGTYLGDPIEAMALGAVLGRDRSIETPCLIGSVKTNFGHLEAASGIAGLIKAALSLKRSEIPASLHFREPNPAIAFDKLGLKVQTSTAKWPDYGKPLYAGVSAFGFGGSNVHVVLEAPPKTAHTAGSEYLVHILPLSAHSPEALAIRAQAAANWLEAHADVSLNNVCFTASVRRTHMEYRVAVIAGTHSEMCEALKAFAAGRDHPAIRSGRRASRPPKRLWQFAAGAPTEWPSLCVQEGIVRETLLACDTALAGLGASSLFSREVLSTDVLSTAIGQTSLQIALSAYWRELGHKPHAVAADAAGLPAGLYAAGVLTLSDALRLALLRDTSHSDLGSAPELPEPRVPVFISPQQLWLRADPFQPAGSSADANGSISADNIAIPTWHELAVAVRAHASPIEISIPAQWAGIDIGASSFSGDADTVGSLFLTAAALFVRGCEPSWSALFPNGGMVVDLPRYPWQHKSYWFDDQREDRASNGSETLPNVDVSHKINGEPSDRRTSILRTPVALLFTGQGIDSSTGRELYDTEEVFRNAIDKCDKILSVHLARSVRDLLFDPALASEMAQTQFAQPALCALEWSLTELWHSWGLHPSAVMGHSLGEYVAACVAGCIEIEELLLLVSKRGSVMQAMPAGGVMAAIRAGAEQIAPLIDRQRRAVSIAAVNGPQSVVISGARESVDVIAREVEAGGISVRYLPVSHAFHSALIADALPGLAEAAASVRWSAPNIPFITNLTGDLMVGAPSSDHWVRHARQSVLFSDGISKLYELGCRTFLEIGPHNALVSMARAAIGSEGILWAASLDRNQDPRITISESRRALENAGAILRNLTAIDLNRKNLMDTDKTSPAHDVNHAANGRVDIASPLHRSYQLQREPSPQNGAGDRIISSSSVHSASSAEAEILEDVRREIAKALGEAPDDINVHAPFIEMGADSLVLAQAVRTVETRYGVSIPLKRFFTDLSTPSALAAFLADNSTKANLSNGNSAPAQQEAPADTSSDAIMISPARRSVLAQGHINHSPIAISPVVQNAGALERIMTRQLDAMTDLMQQQLRVLGQGGAALPGQSPAPAERASDPGAENGHTATDVVPRPAAGKAKSADHGPFRPPRLGGGIATGLSPQQQQHVDGLIERYCSKTGTSKAMAGQYRRWYADSRASAGFRMSIKELLYPIVAGRTDGAHLWDVDGNCYVDISMDFGVNLLGHGASVIRNAQREQWETSIALGPRPKLAGEAAERLCRMTGMERAVFCQSGTEAVMTALRLARLSTGRQKVAIFRNSYHGHSDGVLVGSIEVDGIVTQHPAAPGVPQSVANDVLLLDYGAPDALEEIRRHCSDLAAVLVEPVQSRHPELQPREFLQQVRALTERSGTVLIFDEMITGFRIAPGGAQEWFGVRADLATYGKILGGGVPVAAVAGRRDILDGIDGGVWEYGDSSFPGAEVTFFAGTFCCNPLAMASAVAVLGELERQGSELQRTLAERTARLAETLNHWFEAESVPIRIVHFGSLFRFQFTKNLDLFFFHLLDRGVFIWEGRNCFLSAAHTEDDIAFVVDAVKASVHALRDGGFLPPSPNDLPGSIASTAQSLAPIIHFASHNAPVHTPMSAAQKQLWFLSQVQPEASVAYIEPIVLEIEGSLDIPALHRALNDLVSRHEALRTTIDAAGEAQVIHAKLAVPIVFTDTAGSSQQAEIDPVQWLETVLSEPIDLVAGPLIRAGVLRLSSVRHRFVLAIHHIVVDGWSMSVAASELAQLYAVHTAAGAAPGGIPAQFRQHIMRQGTLLRSPGMSAGRDFWSKMLSAPLPVLELPGDLQRPHPLGWSGSRHTARVAKDVRTRAAQYSAKQGATLFMTLLAAYALWLHRITGQEDLIIGYPTHGRELPAEESVVGYCVNILPLRLQVTERQSFDEFVRYIRGLVLDIDDYKDFPFADMLRALNMSWSEGASPLIAATFNMDRAPEQFELGTLKATLLPAPIHAAKYELSLNVTDTGDHLTLDFDYNRDIFSAKAMERLAAHFAFTLQELTSSGPATLRLGRILEAQDEQALIGLVNDSAVDLPIDTCLHTLVERYATNWPNRIAVVAASDGDGPDDQRLTYAELNDRGEKLARRLRSVGVGLETAVGLSVDRSLDRIVGLIGILKAGGAYVPLSLDEPHDRRLRMLRDAGVDIVLTQRDGLTVFGDDVNHVICIEDDIDVDGLDALDLPEINPENMACVLFTSGTTRHPKGVGVSHRNIANLILGLHKRYPDADTFFHHSSLQFDASTLEIWWPLLTGGRLVVAPPGLLSPDKITRLVARHDVNYLWLTTGLFQLMVEQALPGIQGIPHVMFGGEATSPRRVEEMRAAHWGGVLANAYGPTEGTTFTTTFFIDPRKPIDGPLPIGKPIDNGEVYILDPYGRLAPIGVAGELYLGGEGVTRCYLRQPALTAAAFVPDAFSGRPGARLYRTGDKARVSADGNIEFLGRIDTQIKLRGFRIEPGEIETALVSLDDIEQAIAIVREDTPGDKRLVAYVVAPGTRKPEPVEVMDAVRGMLPPYMMPSACVVLDKLPLTPNGKVDRKALPAPERNRSVNRERALPQTPTEFRLYAIWSDILQVSKFGIADDFFALGGHSLLCMKMVARVNEEFGTAIALRTALDHPTVSGLSGEIDKISSPNQPSNHADAEPYTHREADSAGAEAVPSYPSPPGREWGGEPATAPSRIRAVSREGRRVSREALTRGEAAHE